MCDPTGLAIASFALTAGSIYKNHRDQKKAAQDNREAANSDRVLAMYDASLRGQEEIAAATRAIQAGRAQGSAVRAEITASAGEAGVVGQSVDMLLDDVHRDEAAHVQSIEDNTQVTLDQLQRVKAGATALADSRINSMRGPSAFGTGLQIMGAGLDLYGTLRLRQPRV
jgi:hypothetical protein